MELLPRTVWCRSKERRKGFIWCFFFFFFFHIGEKLAFDVIVCATGFTIVCWILTCCNPSKYWLVNGWQEEFPYTLRGTGPTIQEFNEEKGGPEGYLGTVVPHFPNFYMISGKYICIFNSIYHLLNMLNGCRTEHCYWIYVCLII